MPICFALKGDNTQCTRPGEQFIGSVDRPTHPFFCTTHWNQYDRNVRRAGGVQHIPGNCMRMMSTDRWCERRAVGDTRICEYHQRVIDRANQVRERNRERIRLVENTITRYRLVEPAMTWQAVMRDVLAQPAVFSRNQAYDIALAYYHLQDGTNVLRFIDTWVWIRNGGEGDHPYLQPRAPPVGDLGRLAADGQNVHTRHVSIQTNKSLEILLAETAYHPGVLQSPTRFATRWLLQPYAGTWAATSRVVNDMFLWYVKPTCTVVNDYKYARALDGLFMRIQKIADIETRREIYKRTFQECFESVGMCCEGHISRLCNVLIGFDEAFVPALSMGERIQNEMAKISALADVETDEKIRLANVFFTEHDIPEPDRTPWLAAF